MGEDKDNWASIIRSTVLTSKAPLTPLEINRDTKMLEGRNIPYLQFGYSNLEAMLRDIPGLQISQQGNKTLVRAIATPNTAHIQRMVRLQKSKKKKPRTLPSLYNKTNYVNKYASTYRNQPTGQYRNGYQNRYNQQNNSRPVPNQSYNRPTVSNFQSPQTPRNRPPLLPTPTVQPQTKPPITPVTPPVSTPSQANTPTTPSLRQPTTNRPPLSSTPTAPTPTQQKTVTSAPGPEIQKPASVQQRLQQSVQNRVETPTPVPTTVPKPKTSLSERLTAAKNGGSALPCLTGTPKEQLSQYAKSKKLSEPVYNKKSFVKDRNIYCVVTISQDKKYTSYPTEAKTVEEAENIAAKLALEDLLSKNNTPKIITQDTNAIIRRVVNIVNQHTNGILEVGVVNEYISQFDERLPENWLNFVGNFIKVDVGANDVRFLCPDKKKSHILTPQEEIDISNSISNLCTESEVLNYQDLENAYMNILVVYSTVEIWGVIIDENCSGKLYSLAHEEMAPFYNNNDVPTTVTPDQCYAVFDTEWHRVHCIDYDEEKKEATVFFVDRGDTDIFPADKLRALKQEFNVLPWQAVKISLKDLELFEDLTDVQRPLEDLLLDQDVLVKAAIKDPDATGRSSSFLSVELDLVKEENKIIDVNDYIKKSICTISEPSLYMDPEKISQQVHISHVNEEAIHVQVIRTKKYLDYLVDKFKETVSGKVSHKTKPVLSFDVSKIYLTQSKKDSQWYRVKLLKLMNDKAQAFCIDFGHELTVEKTDLILDDLPELLMTYPAQAVEVTLYKISKFTFDVNLLRQLAPRNEVFYMKVMDVQEKLPVVNFYQRTENNLLAVLNDTLTVGPEITSRDDNNNAKRRNDRLSLTSKNDFPLPSPQIPPIDEEWDVYVTMAAHPGNFTMQPLSSAKELSNMMAELSKVCKNYTGPILTSSNIKIGNMYAAKYEKDGKWYRGYALNLLKGTNVCVIYYVDYGDYRTVTVDQLQILDEKFLSFPYQAIKAKLFGVEPVLKGDWTVEDSLRFIKLTVNKNFVSIVRSLESDKTNVCGKIVGLELIDTTTEENIIISNILIKEKRAEKIKKI